LPSAGALSPPDTAPASLLLSLLSPSLLSLPLVALLLLLGVRIHLSYIY
jgi:hypothetical protein